MELDHQLERTLLRGERLQPQPIVDSATGSVFCWNGEAWLISDERVAGNDTTFLSERLFDALGTSHSPESAVAGILGEVAGPYAFLLYDAQRLKLYFGRDSLGRRSLLTNGNVQGTELTISSVANQFSPTTREVATPQIVKIDLTKPQLDPQVLTLIQSNLRYNSSHPAEGEAASPIPSVAAVEQLIDQLREAVQLRVEAIPTYTAYAPTNNPSRVAVLFSGGLDCSLLTRLTHEILLLDQPIDLLNVAVENPRVVNARAAQTTTSSPASDLDAYESCPDRITGRASFAELSRICPHRTWRFVAINVSYSEFEEHRSTIVQLMFPHNTEMDLSITSALYFAARGQGKMTESTQLRSGPKEYTTTARVLLSGLGADELFGGYARHAAAFNRGGYPALHGELRLDFERIGNRNLGRDDRAISHWGRETRYPFLDETFVQFTLGLPVWEKCGFRTNKAVPKHFETTETPERMEDLHPEKMLLRCAMWRLGMRGAAAEKKRAIQFGARTAKMLTGRTKGTDVIPVNGFKG